MLPNQIPSYLCSEDHGMIIVVSVILKVSKMSVLSLFDISSRYLWCLFFCWYNLQ